MLDGGSGSDTLTGGTGADRFHFYLGSGQDRIIDFSLDDGDRIYLSSSISTPSGWLDGSSAFIRLGDDDVVELAGISDPSELSGIFDHGILTL